MATEPTKGNKLSEAEVYARWENIRSIDDVPRDILPPGWARMNLIGSAAAGEDTYCYQSGGPLGTWCVWQNNKRTPVVDYVANYQPTKAELYFDQHRAERDAS